MQDCVIAEAQGSSALAITANYSGKKGKKQRQCKRAQTSHSQTQKTKVSSQPEARPH